MSATDRSYELRVARRRLDALSQKLGVAPGGGINGSGLRGEISMEAIENDQKLSPFNKQELIMALNLKQYRSAMHALQDMKQQGNAGASQMAKASQEMRRLTKRIGDDAKKLKGLSAGDEEQRRVDEIVHRWDETQKAGRKVTSGSDAYDVPTGIGTGSTPTAATPLISDISSFTDGGATQDRDPEFQMFFERVHERAAEIDRIVDRIAVGVTTLQDNAHKLSGELKVQDVLLNDATKKAEVITTKVNSLNKKVKIIIKQVGQDQMCLYMICCLLLLGLTGAILYETGILKQ